MTIEPPGNINDLVDQYVKLRDKVKKADDEHKKRTQHAKEYLDMLTSKLLEQLNTIGGDSVKTPAGTVYRTERRTASISDGKAFREYVIANEAFDIIDFKANAPAVEDFINSNGTPPPGVNFSKAYTVGVRRS